LLFIAQFLLHGQYNYTDRRSIDNLPVPRGSVNLFVWTITPRARRTVAPPSGPTWRALAKIGFVAQSSSPVQMASCSWQHNIRRQLVMRNTP
jgi:hypothetical protein